ncbi:MAG: hypothetical protein K6G28_01905 [Acholeplasmatales bacterium]|nr:hypothetical protein [Acholeplasmatales bacterium]
MKILITNDDGISSKLIPFVFEELISRGHEVIVCVPDKNNSAVSQAIRFWEYKDNKLTKINDHTYTHPGTPADGIVYYLKEFEKPDLIISGINIGLNAGTDIQYSGTIGAASEAINFNIPSVAISADNNASDETIKRGLKLVLDKIFANNLYSNEYVFSFNIPYEIRDEKIILAPLNKGIDVGETKKEYESLSNLSTHYVKNVGKNTDLYYLLKGYITATPILVDRTNSQIMPKISIFF